VAIERNAMNSIYPRLIRVAFLHAVVCYLVFAGLSTLAWAIVPQYDSDNDLTLHIRWAAGIIAEKITGLMLMSLMAFLAARSYRPTWKIGIITAIATAVIYQSVAIVVYVLRFGVSVYRTYNDFIYTISSAVALGWLFGFLAVWKQYRHERHYTAN
jgi:hypothetical protein